MKVRSIAAVAVAAVATSVLGFALAQTPRRPPAPRPPR
jgi:hypothetical protein